MTTRQFVSIGFFSVLMTAAGTVRAAKPPAEVVIAKDGKAAAVIYVDADVMAPDKKTTPASVLPDALLEPRQRLRDSVNDLALYLEKMSGARVEIATNAPPAGDRRLPILIGELAAAKFGPPARKAPYQQGFRLVVSPKGIGLMGESPLATSYAIYELLERLGCRWYMPSELGEVVPLKKTIRLPAADDSLAPGTIYRGVWYADSDFKRRIRQGGLLLAASHALEISQYIPNSAIQTHPEWFGLVNGKRILHRYCWGNPEVAPMVADAIIKRLDAHYTPTVSLSPDDGADFCECDKCKALDAGDLDPSTGTISITDRYLHFANEIAERVTKKYPDVLFGWLAYGLTMRIPVREKMHPNLIPQIAPITYCRAHTMLQTNLCPSRPTMKPIVENWGKIAKNVSYYNYMFHLAETTVPYPMMRQMSEELPILYANHVTFWQPETMPEFESNLPGMVLTIRMSWDPKLKPADVLDEFFAKFYGAASGPVRRYWQVFDDAWTSVPEHAGCGFGYPRRFTPAVMQEARAAMDASLAACQTDRERRRVKMLDESLRQFELLMKSRWDLFEGRLAEAGEDGAQWLKRGIALGEEYAPQAAFGKLRWTPFTVGGRYVKIFYLNTSDDGARIARDFTVLGPSLRQWRYQVDQEKKGESLGWQQPGFNDRDWKTTDPCLDTWFALGLETYYGPVFYRLKAAVPAVPAGKKVHLWISSTDGTAKVFVNGQHIPYVDAKGKTADEFSGYCQPASFEITAVVKPGADNQITVVSTHNFMNELGTGGLLGPVMLYRDP